MTYKLKQKKNKAMGSEMKFGVNVAAPFVGMKRDEGKEYPFAKQYIIRRSERGARVLVVQEMAEGLPAESGTGSTGKTPTGISRASKLADVLEGGNELEAVMATKAGLVTRLKATVDGHAFRIGDFEIRVGSCRKGAVYRGLVVEVEYMPCCNVADGVAMIEAFFPSIDESGTFLVASDLRDSKTFGRDPHYSVEHTALQTADLFNKVFA